MKLIKTLFELFLLTFVISTYGGLLEETVVVGKIKEVKGSHIKVSDSRGHIHEVKRSDLKLKKQPIIGEEVQFKVKINPKKINTYNFKLSKLKKVSPEHKELLFLSYMNFLKMAEKYISKKQKFKFKGEKTSSFNPLKYISQFIDNAWAVDANCVFAGYPSIMSEGPNPRCLPPWSTEARSVSGYVDCGGGDNVFRCNKNIFGEGARRSSDSDGLSFTPVAAFPGSSVQVYPDSTNSQAGIPRYQHGICVRLEPGRGIIDSCFEASTKNLAKLGGNYDQFHQYLLENGSLLQNFCNIEVNNTGEVGTEEATTMCNYLAKQIERVRFHNGSDNTICRRMEDDTSVSLPEGTTNCSQVRLEYRRDGLAYQGFINKERYGTALPLRAGPNMNFNQLAVGGVFSTRHDIPLFSQPCREDNNGQIEEYGSCIIDRSRSTQLREGFDGPGCIDNLCSIRGYCAQEEGNSESFVPVTAVCECGNGGSTDVDFDNCRRSQLISQMNPYGAGHQFQDAGALPADVSGGVAQ